MVREGGREGGREGELIKRGREGDKGGRGRERGKNGSRYKHSGANPFSQGHGRTGEILHIHQTVFQRDASE